MEPSEIAVAAQMACVIEASAPKPGNVNRYRDFADAHLEDWLLSAAAVGPALAAAGEAGIGVTVLRAVRDTRRWVGTNTNLGIVLLLAPLAVAAGKRNRVERGNRKEEREERRGEEKTEGREFPLSQTSAAQAHHERERGPGGEGPGEQGSGGVGQFRNPQSAIRISLGEVLRETTVADAEAVYEAIRLAAPGGLGRVDEQDVAAAPTLPLRDVMALAVGRDTIAREYVTDFAVTFETTLSVLRTARTRGMYWSDAALEAYLATLAAVPDSLIARKLGSDIAAEVSHQAACVLAAGEPGSPARGRALEQFDVRLRASGNALNPGATADLTAAGLFVAFLEQSPRIRMPP